jgi:hypothetical protein
MINRVFLIATFVLAGCVEPTSDTHLKYRQEAIILRDGEGRIYVATHLNGNTWTLTQ